MTLETLVVVRHGQYDYGLTKIGRGQIQNLAEQLSRLVAGKRIAIVSSSELRARETAQIIREMLGVDSIEEDSILYSSCLSTVDLDELVLLVDKKTESHEVLVLSAHLEVVEFLPQEYCKRKGLPIPILRRPPQKGSARVINVLTGAQELLVGKLN